MPTKRETVLIGIICLLLSLLVTPNPLDRIKRYISEEQNTNLENGLDGSSQHGDAEHICQHHLAQSTSRTSPVFCPVQPEPLKVDHDWEPKDDEEFVKLSHARLQGAIQIRTETFDDMPMNASDPRFDVFYEFEAYLRETFPLFHEQLSFERINVHGLMFTWNGSNPDLKPIVLMAHQDVVPVNPSTWSSWTRPPFSGYLDQDGWIWGRGTTDMKGTLIALMASAERLLEEGFRPERTIIFSHGFDEEIGGPRGAKEIARHIASRYGKHNIALILDEGFTGIDREFNTTFARVGIAEKGCMTITLSIHTPGGHSSRPPVHTGIGIMSRLLVELEDNPTLPRLKVGNPLLTYLECAAEYGDMQSGLERRVRSEECWPALAEDMGKDSVLQGFLKTTQAIDIVNGGIKYNALPENVMSMINYRIDLFETTQDTIDRVISLLEPIAHSYNMTFASFGQHPEVTQNIIRLDTFGINLEPAPFTPIQGKAWDLMGGTIRGLGKDTIVVPSAMTAFTDTRWYWDVSDHIYRFVPASLDLILNYHTVDERIHVDAHIATIKFFYTFMRNTVGWDAP